MVFRGTRDYVHSTDLYSELFAGARAAGLPLIDGIVTLEMRTPLTTQPEFHFGDDPHDKVPVAAAFRLGIRNDLVSGMILPSDRSVVGRKPYDESQISGHARINDRQVDLCGDTGMSPIEVVTALGVFLHKALSPPPPGKRWLLARLSLLRPLQPQDARAITVTLLRTVGSAMTRSAVTGPAGELGGMDFILGGSLANP
jgi:hypothetical protein